MLERIRCDYCLDASEVRAIISGSQCTSVEVEQLISPAPIDMSICRTLSNCVDCDIVKTKHLTRCTSGKRIALSIGMNYDKMKALMQASREESEVQRTSEVTEFPTSESRPDWKYLDAVEKGRKAV